MKKAFTLIELIVVLAIATMLSVGAVMGLANTRKDREFKGAGENVKNYIMQARSMSLSPSDTDYNVAGYRVKVYPYNSSSAVKNKVEIYKVAPPIATGAETLVSSYVLKAGVQLESVATPGGSHGNMNRSPASGAINYYYITFKAGFSSSQVPDNTLGQVSDLASDPSLTIFSPDDATLTGEYYKITINVYSGLITNQKCTAAGVCSDV